MPTMTEELKIWLKFLVLFIVFLVVFLVSIKWWSATPLMPIIMVGSLAITIGSGIFVFASKKIKDKILKLFERLTDWWAMK